MTKSPKTFTNFSEFLRIFYANFVSEYKQDRELNWIAERNYFTKL